MKSWHSKEFNGSEWTDSSLLTTSTLLFAYTHTKAFPMTACAGPTAHTAGIIPGHSLHAPVLAFHTAQNYPALPQQGTWTA